MKPWNPPRLRPNRASSEHNANQCKDSLRRRSVQHVKTDGNKQAVSDTWQVENPFCDHETHVEEKISRWYERYYHQRETLRYTYIKHVSRHVNVSSHFVSDITNYYDWHSKRLDYASCSCTDGTLRTLFKLSMWLDLCGAAKLNSVLQVISASATGKCFHGYQLIGNLL